MLRDTAFFGLLLLPLLAACGRPQAPGFPQGRRPVSAPQLRFLQPRPEARFAIWDELRGLGRVEVLFDLVDPDPRAPGPTIRFTVGDAAPTEVRDPSLALVRKPGRGTHLLRAWLLDAQGQVVHAQGAHAVTRIHVGEAPPPATLPLLGPTLTWAAPWGPAPRTGPGSVQIDVLLTCAALEPYRPFQLLRRRLQLTLEDDPAAGMLALQYLPERPLPVPGLAPGTHRVRVALAEHAGTMDDRDAGWREVPGAAVEHEIEVR